MRLFAPHLESIMKTQQIVWHWLHSRMFSDIASRSTLQSTKCSCCWKQKMTLMDLQRWKERKINGKKGNKIDWVGVPCPDCTPWCYQWPKNVFRVGQWRQWRLGSHLRPVTFSFCGAFALWHAFFCRLDSFFPSLQTKWGDGLFELFIVHTSFVFWSSLLSICIRGIRRRYWCWFFYVTECHDVTTSKYGVVLNYVI